MGKKTTTRSLTGWEPYLYGNGNTQSTYDPYAMVQFGPQTWQQYQTQQTKKPKCGLGASDAQKLDKMTRSRNALIIAVAVFVAAFIGCFIAVFILAYPLDKDSDTTTTASTTTATTTTTVAAVTTTNIQIVSVFTAQTYASDMATSTSTAFTILGTELCDKIRTAAEAAATINSCTVNTLVDAGLSATPSGVKGTTVIVAVLDGKTAEERRVLVSARVVAAATSTWTVIDPDITTVA